MLSKRNEVDFLAPRSHTFPFNLLVHFTIATDVWSFGIVLWEIATLGDIPYPNLPKVEHLLTLLKNKRRMPKPSHCSDTLYNLMKSCWEELPGERPDFEVISYKVSTFVHNGEVKF